CPASYDTSGMIASSGGPLGARTLVQREPSRAGEEPCDQGAEGEAPDVGEEGDSATVRAGAEEPEICLDELIDEPCPEEDPGGYPDRVEHHQRQNPGAGVDHEVRAQDRCDGATRP